MPKITVDGAEHEVPDAVAAHLTKTGERLTALEVEAKARAEEAGRLKAEADSKTREQEETKRKADMEAAAKKGEVEKVVELAKAKETKYAAATLARDVRSAIAAHADVKKTGLDDKARSALIEDLAALVSVGLTFDLDTGRHLDASGKAVDLSAAVAAAVAARPWFAEPKLPGGTGAGETKNAPAKGTGTKAALKAAGTHLDYIDAHGHEAWNALPN